MVWCEVTPSCCRKSVEIKRVLSVWACLSIHTNYVWFCRFTLICFHLLFQNQTECCLMLFKYFEPANLIFSETRRLQHLGSMTSAQVGKRDFEDHSKSSGRMPKTSEQTLCRATKPIALPSQPSGPDGCRPHPVAAKNFYDQPPLQLFPQIPDHASSKNPQHRRRLLLQ